MNEDLFSDRCSDDQSTSSDTYNAEQDWRCGSDRLHGSFPGDTADNWTHQHIKQEATGNDVMSHKMTSRRHGADYSHMTSEAEQRLRIRRERNKQAAARCRQRRVDLTNHLLAETEFLEEERAKLQLEVNKLQRQRHNLEFVLKSHSTQCAAAAPVEAHNVAGHQPNMRQNYVTTCRPISNQQRPAHIQIPRSTYQGHPAGQAPAAGFDSYSLEDCFNGPTGLTPVINPTTGQPSFDVMTSGDVIMPGNMLSPTTLMTL